MLGSPLPPLTAGLGKAASLIAVLLVIFARHIHAILLHVITVVTETIYILVGYRHTCLHQLVVLVVAHSQCGVECTSHKQVDILGKPHKFVIQVILDTHADGQLPEPHTPDTHAGTFLLERVLIAGRHDNHRVVHGCLQDVDQGDTAVHDLQGLTDLQRRGLTLIIT